MNRKTRFLALAFLLFFSATSFAQVGANTGLWKWTKRLPHHDTIVEVISSGGTGTGVVISINKDKPIKDGFEGYVLTAWHVIQDDIKESHIKVRYRNGRRSKGCKVVQYDEAKDVALIWVWVPGDIPAAKMASEPIKRGEQLEFAGLGGGSKLEGCIRHFSATASSPSTLEKIFADVPLLPGDSGGPVFNSQHQVVGIISGGWFWYDSGVKTENGFDIRTTWPARASNVGPIKTLMASLESKAGGAATTAQYK